MSPDTQLQVREFNLTRRLQYAAITCTTPDVTHRLIAFALRCIKDMPLPGGTTFAQRPHVDHFGLLEVVRVVEWWLGGRPLAQRHRHLHVDVVRPDPVRSAVHHLLMATLGADTAGANPDKLGEAAGHACTAAFTVRRAVGQTWPTPRALAHQERVFAGMFAGCEQAECPAAW
jgi:hypothetical protein